MEITERQKIILNKLVEEYIKSALPVSSQLLERKCNLNVCPATIRGELKQLDKLGFLSKPYISAGRVPTDKGYRFFVDNILEKILRKENERFVREVKEEIKKMKDMVDFAKELTNLLASFSSTLTFTYLKKNKILWKEGWIKLFSMPEFKNFETLDKFLKNIRILERNISDLCSFFDEEIKIFIGKENPLRSFKNFTLLGLRISLPFEKKCYFILFGLKRMDYHKNITLLKSLRNVLKRL